MSRPRILYIYDVPNWGGEERGFYLQKYLSDIFDIDLIHEITIKENNYEIDKTYDLYYLAYHTMLGRGYTNYLDSKRIVCMITGRKVMMDIFKKSKEVMNEKIPKEEYLSSLMSKCCGVFVNNMLALKELKAWGKYKGTISYVPRGVDENLFKPIIDYPNDRFTLCYVGKPVPEKGLEDIIKPAAIKAGCNLIHNTKIWDEALPKNKMVSFYNKCNAYIVASTIDGTPNPMLEAASCGRPIISNIIGNAPEFIVDGYNGFLVRRDVESYVEKIQWMKSNFEKAKIMGENARKTILEGWTWRHSMQYEREAIKKALEA